MTLRAYQLFQGFDVASIVSRFVDWRLRDEGSVSQARMVQQPAEGFEADGSLPDMLMTIEFRSANRFGVVAMPDAHVLQSDGFIEVRQRLLDTFGRHDVVAGDVGVASVDAGSDRHEAAEAIEDFGYLFEAPAERIFGAGSIFDEDGEIAFSEIETLAGGVDCRRGLQQSGFSIGPAK
jgi:hypothetical protein